MLLQNLMKNPVLMIGILMMSIFLMSLSREGKIFHRENLVPTSCKAVLVKLDRRIPASWTTECQGNNLNINITKTLQPKEAGNIEMLRSLLYRELANDLIAIANNSPSDNLERTDLVSLKLRHAEMEIGALTEGKFIVKFSTLRDQRLIMEHLQQTVQVQEVIPEAQRK